MKKIIFLSVLFVIPIAGVLVFNFFSKSHFNIPVYYEESLPDDINCEGLIVPYQISKELKVGQKVSQLFEGTSIKIVALSDGSENFRTQINRIADSYYGLEHNKIYNIHLGKDTLTIPLATNVESITADSSSVLHLKECVFLIQEGSENDALLVDFENRIRGYYNLDNREQADSLIIEGKILLREKDF